MEKEMVSLSHRDAAVLERVVEGYVLVIIRGPLFEQCLNKI